MKIFSTKISFYIFIMLVGLHFSACDKLNEYNQQPDLESFQQGFKTSVAISYCASIVASAAKGQPLPENVTINKKSGLIYVHIDKNHPLPFNKNVGDIVIAYLWNNNSGIMSVLFSKIDILGGNVKLYGLYTVPVLDNNLQEGIKVVYAKQDILLGNGSDTILYLGNITDIVYNSDIDRLNSEKPTDATVAIKQNFWIVDINQNNTSTNILDDDISISGGGQIVEANSSSGGIIYHAMINTKAN